MAQKYDSNLKKNGRFYAYLCGKKSLEKGREGKRWEECL
jgi:hypothetical protein